MAAAAIGRDLRIELEHIMQQQMKIMLMVLEDRLTQAVVEGNYQVAGGGRPSASGFDRTTDKYRLVPGAKENSRLPEKSAASSGGKYQKMLVATDEPQTMRVADDEPRSARDVYRAIPTEQGQEAEAEDPEDYEEMIKAQRYQLNLITLWMLVISAMGDAFEVDHQARNRTDESPEWYKWLQLLMCIGFAVEFAKRVGQEGLVFFYKGNRLNWHYFQFILVASQILDTIMVVQEWWFGIPVTGFGAQIKAVLNVIASIRILRAFHVIDHLDYAAELHLLIASMNGSLRSLAWSALFMLIPTFVLTVVLTQSVAKFCIDSHLDHSKLADLEFYYGTLDRSLLTLFICISGGLSWSEALFPLQDYGFFWESGLFLFYIAAMVFAVLNIVTGVFVNSAQSAASSEKEKSIITKLKKIFKDVDADGSGNLTQDEFRDIMHHKDIGVCLQSLCMSPAQASGLFALIDQDGSGSIASDEFLDGCHKFQGSLKAIDFAFFALEFNHMRTDVMELRRELGVVHRLTGFGTTDKTMSDSARSWFDWNVCKSPSRQ